MRRNEELFDTIREEARRLMRSIDELHAAFGDDTNLPGLAEIIKVEVALNSLRLQIGAAEAAYVQSLTAKSSPTPEGAEEQETSEMES